MKELTIIVPGTIDARLFGVIRAQKPHGIKEIGYNRGNERECRSDARNILRRDIERLVPMCPNSTPSSRWTTAEDDYLREHYLTQSHPELAQSLGRTVNAIRHRCALLGCCTVEKWTLADVEALKHWYKTHPSGTPLELDKLAHSLGRLKSNVARKARAYGLTDLRRASVEKINGRYKRRIPKFATDEERRAYQSDLRKEWISEHGHPRGMLGKKHTAELRSRMVEISRANWQAMTPQEIETRRLKRLQTNLSRYGTGHPGMLSQSNPYSRTKSGKRADLDGLFVRSSWEANYARYLNWLIGQGEIQKWEYEADVFVFHGETRGAITYRPDFKVTEKNGDIIYHEVKGWMDGPSKTRLKRMKKHYPDVKVIVIGEDEYKAISKWKGLIPEWE
jgi:hypothetical protein